MRFWIIILLFVASALHASPAVHGKPGHHSQNTDNYGYLLLAPQASAWSTHLRGRPAGFLRYERKAPTFNLRLHARGLQRQQDYTLIYFPDPFPGDRLICIASGTTNRGGALSLAGQVELNTRLPAVFDDNYPDGARLLLVLADDVDCDMRRMLTWQPQAYLFGKWLIKYIDTDADAVADYSGSWCLRRDDATGESVLDMTLTQSGTDVTAEIAGLSFSGTLSERTLSMTGLGPEGELLSVELVFSEQGDSFTGAVSSSAESFNVTGSSGQCYDYEDPLVDPVCSLPVAEPGLVVGGQQFNSVYAGVVHQGLDFTFDTPLPVIVAPCQGVVTQIRRHAISLDNIIFSVTIRYNAEWEVLIAFEPYSPDPAIADLQAAEIDISAGDVVNPGDILGRLIVPGTEFSHIHWGMHHAAGGVSTAMCPRDSLTPAAAAQLDALYIDTLGLDPVCLDPPVMP
jgi:hypothetical protein